MEHPAVLQNTDGTWLLCPFLPWENLSLSWEIPPKLGNQGSLLSLSDLSDFIPNLFYLENEKILHVLSDFTGSVITLAFNPTGKHTEEASI